MAGTYIRWKWKSMAEDMTLKKIIEFAVATEELGANFYSRMSHRFSDKAEVSEIFSRLSRDEEVHRKQFSAMLEDLPEQPGITDAPEKREYVKAMSISEFFSDRGPFKDADKIEDRDDVLEMAFNFEKDTLGFYQAIQDVMLESNTLKEIIEAEKEHVRILMRVMMAGAKFRSLQDAWYGT